MKKTLVLGLALLLALAGFAVLFVGAANADETNCNTPTLTETTVVHHPAVTHEETVTVIDKPAIPGTEDVTERVWLVWTGGPVDGPPPVDAPREPGGWNTPNGDPNGQPHQGHADLVPYQVGNGNGDWFMWDTVVVEEGTDPVPAVTHDETRTVTDSEAFDETVTTEIENPDYPCDKPDTPDTPDSPENPDEPKVDKPDAPKVTSVEKKVKSEPVEVPTSINSGL